MCALVTGVQTCALPIFRSAARARRRHGDELGTGDAGLRRRLVVSGPPASGIAPPLTFPSPRNTVAVTAAMPRSQARVESCDAHSANDRLACLRHPFTVPGRVHRDREIGRAHV